MPEPSFFKRINQRRQPRREILTGIGLILRFRTGCGLTVSPAAAGIVTH
jgi:hypothetical protein